MWRISAHLGNDPLAVQDVQTTGHKYANSHPCHLVGEFVENEPPEEYGNGKFNVSERCKGNGRGFCVCPDVAEVSACSHHSNEREYPYVLRQRRFPDGGHDSGEDDSAGYCYDREGNECRSGVGEFAVENEIKRQACALVAGDKGYMPLVEQLISDGMKINVIFWDQAARELKETCSNFISLNQHLEILKPRVRENRENMLQTA